MNEIPKEYYDKNGYIHLPCESCKHFGLIKGRGCSKFKYGCGNYYPYYEPNKINKQER